MRRVEAEDQQQMVRDRGRVGSGTFGEWIRSARVAAVAVIATALLTCMTPHAFAAGMAEEDVPATSVVPDSMDSSSPASSPSKSTSKPRTKAKSAAATEPSPEASREEPASTPSKTTSTRSRTTAHHRSSHASASARNVEVEPGTARLKLVQDTWAYAAPAKHSKRLEQLHSDKYVIATGSTKYFLQVKLKNGEIAYVEPSAVNLITQTDKVFQLTHDAAVLDKPNRWAKKIAEVHQPHSVHVIGLALNYMMIKMKNGLVGFIPSSALQ